jgi:mannose-1-phosphate guanylyltransferase
MYAVIMAGGSGTRFWPVSRELRPKQFLKIIGDKPMVVATHERIQSIIPDDHVLLVIGEQHRGETERLFAGSAVRILAEPIGRNTAPCIGLAAKYVEHLGGGNEPVIILPADHYIADSEAFRTSLLQAARIASGGAIVTLGIIPTRPETGYGYIRRQSQPAGDNSYRVREFVEKPDLQAAQVYMLSGDYYWNAGIFVATPHTLLEEFKRQMPDLWEGLERLSMDFDKQGFKSALRSVYERIEGISFDYAIMEKTTRPIYVIPCDCGWSDVGSWYSLYEVRIGNEQDDFGNVAEGNVLFVDCSDSLLLSRGNRLLAALGLRKLLVVDTDDALLVADLERSQEVKSIINRLKDADSTNLL